MRRTILYLFAIALTVRILISLVRATQGLTFAPTGFEGLDDFDGIYIAQLTQLSHGLIPYRDFAVSYPPLFLYVLYPFYLIGGASVASVPIIVSDAATAIVIFCAVERLSGGRLALAAGLAYALSPFALYYEGYVWYSSQPMTFFATLGVYFALRQKPTRSLSALAVAILIKQQAIFFLPVLLAFLIRQSGRRLLTALIAFSTIVLGVSLPFLIASSHGYLTLVTYGLLGRWPGSTAAEQLTNTATCQNILTNASGTLMSCVYGSTTYSQVVNNDLPAYALFFNALSYDLDILAGVVAIPLFLLLIPALYSLRRHRAIVPLVCAFAGAGFLILFSIVFHPALRYYYLPVYALLLMAVVNRGTLAVAIAAPILSLLTPSGAFQELVPLLAFLATAAVLSDSSFRKSSSPDQLVFPQTMTTLVGPDSR